VVVTCNGTKLTSSWVSRDEFDDADDVRRTALIKNLVCNVAETQRPAFHLLALTEIFLLIIRLIVRLARATYYSIHLPHLAAAINCLLPCRRSSGSKSLDAQCVGYY